MRYKFDDEILNIEMEVTHQLKQSVLNESLAAFASNERAITMCSIAVDRYPAGTVLILARCDMDRGRIIDSLGMMPLVIQRERYSMSDELLSEEFLQ